MALTRELAQDIADHLQGTCHSLASSCDAHDIDYDDLSWEDQDTLHNIVDDTTFECACCGWWCEVGDWIDVGTDENVCTQCAREEYGVEYE